jgi:Domain of unknown function (DUF4149)
MVLSAVALLSAALLLGGMAFFAAVMAPLIFAALPADAAGRFVRRVFPAYYLWIIAASSIGALALLPLRMPDAIGFALVAASAAWLRQGLMPRINALSDAAQAGDASAKAGFARAHQLSVLVNVAQMLVALVVLLRFA